MKKTLQTLMTAAMFTAAATSSLSAEASLIQDTAGTEAAIYGPPWIMAAPGDMNYDFRLDATDLTLLKQLLLEERSYEQSDTRLGDVNQDGDIDKADVKELIRRLTGRPEDEDLPEETTTAVVTDTTTDTTITTTVMTLYGPPPAWN